MFELSPNQDGSWTETVLYTFCQNASGNECLDGVFPSSQLTLDTTGNLYGTTTAGGSGHLPHGTVFELSPGPTGWTETVLYNFCSLGEGNYCLDGAHPVAGVTFDQSGNLYGTTQLSGFTNGNAGTGTVYKMTPGPTGWTHTIVHDFANSKSGGPAGEVTFDAAGTWYTTFAAGGRNGQAQGGVVGMTPGGTLRKFYFNGSNGAEPKAGVLLDPDTGSLYGTTSGNGATRGNVYKIGPKGKETVLYNFCVQFPCTDGTAPTSGLIQDQSGNLYGTTELGGAYGLGVVYEITH